MAEMDAQACPYDPFCLGLCEWTDCPGQLTAMPHPNNPPNSAPPSPATMIAQAPGSHTLDFSKAAIGLPPSHERFSSFVEDEKLAVLCKGMIPAKVLSGLFLILTLGRMQETNDILLIRSQTTSSCAMTLLF